MIVGMVDNTSWWRPSTPTPPRPQPPTRNAVADVNRLMRGADTRLGYSGPEEINQQAKIGKAIGGTILNALDVPVQAIGGMHRDAAAGNTLRGQSAGSRAVQDYGRQVAGLWSDTFKPGPGQTPMFQPREFDAAGEAAINRFGLEGAGAGAVRGGATALDLLTGLATGGVGGVVRGAATNAPLAAARARPLLTGFSEDASQKAYRQALLNRVLTSPDTTLGTVRSSQSLPGIMQSGRFKTSAETGTSGAQVGGSTRGGYDEVRQAAEEMMGGQGQRVYGALTNPISQTVPAPFQIGQRGQRRYEDWLSANELFSPAAAEIYGTRPLDVFPDNFPIRYELSPNRLKESQIYFGDSMLPQYTESAARQARTGLNYEPRSVTSSIPDILASGEFPGVEQWLKGGFRPSYVEGSVPNLSLDDIARVQPLSPKPSVGKKYEQTVRDALASVGRDIPVEAIPNTMVRERLLERPPRLSEQAQTQLNVLLNRLRNFTNPRRNEIFTDFEGNVF
jgi:hypothetical protein